MFKLCFLLCVFLCVFTNPPDLSIFDKFQQNDYKLKFERAEAVSHNKHITQRFEVINFKYNPTCTAANWTMQFNVDFDNNFEAIVQTYKFMSNEYRLFPLRFQVNVCFAFSKNLGGLARFDKCGNFTGCPTQKGKLIHICNWKPDESKLPPFMPNGRYMIEVQMLHISQEVAVMRTYGEIYRPIAIPN